MEKRSWSRELECNECGLILTITAKDEIKINKVSREDPPTLYVFCFCGSMVNFGNVPNAIRHKALFG